MTEEKNTQNIEESESKNDELKIEQTHHKETDENANIPSSDGKGVLIMIVVIIGAFALFFGGFNLYNHFTAAEVVDIDDMHQNNLDGELDEEEGLVYNGFSFVKVDGLWWTEFGRRDTLLKVPLHFNPQEVEHIIIEGELDEDSFNQGEVYLSIDPKVVNKYYTLSLSELSFNIVKGLEKEVTAACTEASADCEGRPILSCDNTQGNTVIEIGLSEESGITLNGTCIKIYGNDYEIVKAANRLIYQWYGIMN
jgi:hypothetical protein